MDPFIGQVVMFAGNFAPIGWAFCDGQLLSINQYSALFSVLGTTYGGDGVSTFALPDLRGRVPVHPGHGPGLSDYRLGEKGGAETASLTSDTPATQMSSSSLSHAGGGEPVDIRQPFGCVQFILALQGIYPSRS